MRFSKRTAVLTALLLAVALPSGLAAQRPAGEAHHAAVAVYSGGVDFLPGVAYRQAVLTVSGNGETYTYKLDSGRRPSIGMFSPDGQLLADGSYSWQLEMVPTEATAKRLRAEAAENGGRPLAPWAAQSGSFTIRNGSIADPALAEAQERSAAPDRRGVQSSSPSAGSFAAAGPGAEDGDAAVGSRVGAEAQMNAAARRQAPVAARGGLAQPDRRAAERSDEFATAIGRSLERAAAPDNQLSAPPRAPRPRSDGSNGRPRS